MFKGTLSGDGRPGPIEERLGRKLLRLVDPESDEGQKLLGEGEVELVGPDGECLGRVSIRQAYEVLIARLESRISKRGRIGDSRAAGRCLAGFAGSRENGIERVEGKRNHQSDVCCRC